MTRSGHGAPGPIFLIAVLGMIVLTGPVLAPLCLVDVWVPLGIAAEAAWISFLGYWYFRWARPRGWLGIAPVVIYALAIALCWVIANFVS